MRFLAIFQHLHLDFDGHFAKDLVSLIPVELFALFDTHHTIGGGWFLPFISNKEGLNLPQHHFKQRQTTT